MSSASSVGTGSSSARSVSTSAATSDSSGSGSPWGPVTARHAGYEVDTVDTTGAGDAFTAGVLDAFAAGETDARAVLARANAVAAAATTRAGGTAPLPDIDTVTNRD